MIVRILGEGQLEVTDADMERLNALDADLQAAVDSGDEATFKSALGALLGEVRSCGHPLPDDALTPSDFVLPSADAGLAEVRELLTDEGLIPG